ncbi:hypothetical protein P154DRAFT_300380 [Amniculicola lignicola CBS 123094]|uniref:Uncharacterized protein n=1 Tax=Amniculicola lignicola CBS 123094 TaxID=1392246 RepID=A0A6A5W7B3_9PLEO|nr:hypothetical protein P154DRAFT_300380 [Amniculicola lignicola CBS 123094]
MMIARGSFLLFATTGFYTLDAYYHSRFPLVMSHLTTLSALVPKVLCFSILAYSLHISIGPWDWHVVLIIDSSKNLTIS